MQQENCFHVIDREEKFLTEDDSSAADATVCRPLSDLPNPVSDPEAQQTANREIFAIVLED